MSPAGFDTTLFHFINGHLANKPLDAVMVFASKSSYLLIIPIALLFLITAKKRGEVLLIFLIALASFALSDWAGSMLKTAIGRVRPCAELAGVRLLVGCSGSFSMPSNHAANAFAVLAPFWLLSASRLRHLMLGSAVLIAVSRVYVGVHYPSDVLAGAFLGSAAGLAVTGFFLWSLKKEARRGALIIFLFAVTLFRVYYIQSGPMELSPDEAHYWLWSKNLDTGYYSKGPAIAYLIRAGTILWGDTELGVRFLAPFLSLLGSVILYRLGSLLHDEQVGFHSAILFQVVPLFSTFGVVMTIDAPFVFFWILSLFLVFRASSAESLPRWLLAGLAVGMGLLTKFTMAFLPLSALLWMLSTEKGRRELSGARPYLGLALSLLVVLPLVLWNIEHEFVNLRHNIGHANIKDGLSVSPAWLLNFLGSQLGVVTPLLFAMIVYALLRQRKADPLSFWFAVPTLGFFLIKSLQGKVQANWAMAGYITGLIAFSSVFLKDINRAAKWKKTLVGLAVGIALLVSAAAHYPGILGLPAKLDPSARLRGWKALAAEVDRLAASLEKQNAPFFILSDSYQVSSELAFYMKGQPATYCANLGRRMNQFDLWPGFHDKRHQNSVFVKIGDSEMPEELINAFARNEKHLFVAYEKGGTKALRQYSIFLCYDFQGMEKKDFKRF